MRLIIFLLCAGIFLGGCNRTSKNLRFYTDIEPTKVKIETTAKAAEKEVVKVIEKTVIPEQDPEFHIILYFAFDSDRLTPQSIDKLKQAAEALKNRKGPVGAVGHTCPIGNDDYNYDLGMRRSNRARNYIKDLVPCQVLSSSVGETNLATTDPEKYNLNRRVVLKTLK